MYHTEGNSHQLGITIIKGDDGAKFGRVTTSIETHAAEARGTRWHRSRAKADHRRAC
jgi:hypothetical protein